MQESRELALAEAKPKAALPHYARSRTSVRVEACGRRALPQLKNEVDRAASPAALWVELKREFDRAYNHDEDAVIRSVHDYAMWMVERDVFRRVGEGGGGWTVLVR